MFLNRADCLLVMGVPECSANNQLIQNIATKGGKFKGKYLVSNNKQSLSTILVS